MTYGPILRKTELQGGKNILAREELRFEEPETTVDPTTFPAGVNGVGALVARNEATGKLEPFTAVEGFDDFGVLNEDFRNDYEQDLIAGEVIVRGSVYED